MARANALSGSCPQASGSEAARYLAAPQAPPASGWAECTSAAQLRWVLVAAAAPLPLAGREQVVLRAAQVATLLPAVAHHRPGWWTAPCLAAPWALELVEGRQAVVAVAVTAAAAVGSAALVAAAVT